ncbi:TA system VapC family ribonuclease toxin [Roseateles sp.]|uniref:TA system VapC family ribonuclease toxin n=1 Tax=Roseateles sp. TaxID=1971397 RepID=UPI00286AB1AA|nr:TA system VapC family ribonuclease toxin [Roseateles sp.]
MLRSLLDVNILVALLDGGHLHHGLVSDWLRNAQGGGWASCPLTQNGCLRILSLPAYPNPQPVALVAQRLARAVAHPSHQFWPDSLSLLDPGRLQWDRMLSSRQVTDTYLLALAVEQDACLVTLDQGISLQAVPAAKPKNILTLL